MMSVCPHCWTQILHSPNTKEEERGMDFEWILSVILVSNPKGEGSSCNSGVAFNTNLSHESSWSWKGEWSLSLNYLDRSREWMPMHKSPMPSLGQHKIFLFPRSFIKKFKILPKRKTETESHIRVNRDVTPFKCRYYDTPCPEPHLEM